MTLGFRTTQTGDFAVFRADSPDDLITALGLKQEYVNEATTSLAESAIKKPDPQKNIAAVVLFSTAVILAGGLRLELRRRKRQ